MRIKKINDDKVQIIITNQDLEERDFKKWEMMPISPKAQELFQDILDMAYEECGFEIEDDSQLVVEAYPLSVDSFAVVMTKVRAHVISDHININGMLVNQSEGSREDSTVIERGTQQIWAIDSLELCSKACARVISFDIESSRLYKYEEQYCLAVETSDEHQFDISAIMGEYGNWFQLDEAYLKEHGKLLIPREAVANMASLLK